MIRRLTPAYMFVLLIAEISMRWIHNNSVFEPISQNHISCDKYWWRNILYINSLFPMNDMVSILANHPTPGEMDGSCTEIENSLFVRFLNK